MASKTKFNINDYVEVNLLGLGNYEGYITDVFEDTNEYKINVYLPGFPVKVYTMKEEDIKKIGRKIHVRYLYKCRICGFTSTITETAVEYIDTESNYWQICNRGHRIHKTEDHGGIMEYCGYEIEEE